MTKEDIDLRQSREALLIPEEKVKQIFSGYLNDPKGDSKQIKVRREAFEDFVEWVNSEDYIYKQYAIFNAEDVKKREAQRREGSETYLYESLYVSDIGIGFMKDLRERFASNLSGRALSFARTLLHIKNQEEAGRRFQ
jgi:hypothetical protein